MIPSDHFVRYYNEVFKALETAGHEHLVAYWRELGELQTAELADSFKRGGLAAAMAYWQRIVREENCEAELSSGAHYFEFRMLRCPSLGKVLDNDAEACDLYCDHCMAWVEPVMEAAGLHAVMDMESRREPQCVFRVYDDVELAAEYERSAKLPSHPYGRGETTT